MWLLAGIAGGLVGLLGPHLVRWAAGEDADEVPVSRWLTVPATAVTVGVLAWRLGPTWVLPAVTYLAVVGVLLVIVDIAVHRLPDRLTLSSYPIVAVLLVVASAGSGDWTALLRALIGGFALCAVYFVLAFLAGGEGMGLGDVKLAGILGAVLAWVSWTTLITGGFLGFLFGGVLSAVLLVTRRVNRKTRIAFGPFMVLGAFTALVVPDVAVVLG